VLKKSTVPSRRIRGLGFLPGTKSGNPKEDAAGRLTNHFIPLRELKGGVFNCGEFKRKISGFGTGRNKRGIKGVIWGTGSRDFGENLRYKAGELLAGTNSRCVREGVYLFRTKRSVRARTSG